MPHSEHTPEVAARSSATAESTGACGCDVEKLNVVHRYLEDQFKGSVLRDFHAPVRLMQAGLPSPHGEHHVVSIERPDVLPYHAVLLNEFLARSPDAISDALQRWNVADVLRANRIAVLAANGASAL